MELFKNISVMRITRNELNNMIVKSINSQVNEGKFGRAMAGLGLAATLATAPACSHFNHYEPQWEHVGPYSEQEKQEKTWNTHAERGDWDNIEPGVGFCYDCYTRCAKNGGGWTVHVIFADRSTGKFILPQECREYLNGRYMPNCNCFENENTTDKINTNGLQRLNGNENTTVFENKNRHNMKKQTIKLNESQLRQMIQEALNELAPQTYARYAAMRQQQANGEIAPSQSQVNRGLSQQQMQAQADQGRSAAIDQWNKNYGWNETDKNGLPNRYEMPKTGKNYRTEWERSMNNGWGPTSVINYNPETGNEFQRNREGYETWDVHSTRDELDGDAVARQMQHGVPYQMKQPQQQAQPQQPNLRMVAESQLRSIIKESIMNILSEEYGNVNPRDVARSEGAHVVQYTQNMFKVVNGTRTNTYFYVDRNGKFYTPNGQPTTNVHTLVDADAESVANELNKTIGNMFHWDMFRRQNNSVNE